jgi:hypothetical protein
MTFYKPNCFQNDQKGECFLDDFEALVRSRNVILKVVSQEIINEISKTFLLNVNVRHHPNDEKLLVGLVKFDVLGI